MKIFGQLERAQAEILAADPAGANLVQGRIWFNSSSGQFKYYDGSSVQVITNAAISADALAAAMTTTGTGSIVSTMTSGNADTIAGKISTTGTGSLVSTATAANANTLVAKVTRATGTSVSEGGVAISSSSGAFFTSSTTYVDVTNLSVTIVTSGRPISLVLIPDGSLTSYVTVLQSSAGTPTAVLKILRDVTNIGEAVVSTTATGGGVTSTAIYLPPGSISNIDAVAAGTYTYKVQGKVTGGAMTLGVNGCKLIAFEL